MTAIEIEQILNLSPIRLEGDEVYHEDTYICKIESVSSWRMKYILQEDELLDDADTFLNGLGGLPLFAWENSLEIDRVSGACEALRLHLNKTHEYVNELFERAREIEL